MSEVIKLQSSFIKIIELKDMLGVSQKITVMLEMLEEAQAHLKNLDEVGISINQQPNFLTNLESLREHILDAKNQVSRYVDSNVLKKKFIQDDVRMKLKTIAESFNVMTF